MPTLSGGICRCLLQVSVETPRPGLGWAGKSCPSPPLFPSPLTFEAFGDHTRAWTRRQALGEGQGGPSWNSSFSQGQPRSRGAGPGGPLCRLQAPLA